MARGRSSALNDMDLRANDACGCGVGLIVDEMVDDVKQMAYN